MGLFIASVGWLLRGTVLVVVAHVIWLVIAHLWFSLGGPKSKSKKAARAKGRSQPESKGKRS